VESEPASTATVAAPPAVQPLASPARPATAQPQGAPAVSAPANPASPNPSPAGGQASLRLDPESVAPQQGSTFALNIVLAHGQDITAVPIQITYDAKVVQFVSVSNGDYLSRDGQQVALVHRNDAAAGKLQVTAQRPPGSAGVSGDGTVFSLLFMAKAKGTGAVSISMPGARNSQNQMVEVLGSQAAVNVN
jgi:general secretion pathway protein D